MDFEDIRKTLEEYFEDNWVVDVNADPLVPITPIAWDNVLFDNSEEVDEWVRFSIVFATSSNMTLGGNRTKTPGFISVQVFTKPDTGTGAAAVLADKIKAVLQNKTIGRIFTYATSVEVIGDAIRKINKIEYGEYQLVVKTRFEAT